jgi:hypothetical protein
MLEYEIATGNEIKSKTPLKTKPIEEVSPFKIANQTPD